MVSLITPVMLRLPILLAIAFLGLCACNDDDDDDDVVVTPTPTPSVTPTPTPSTDEDEDGTTDDDTDNDGIEDSDESDGVIDTGALMVAADELVRVSSVDSTVLIGTLLTVTRANGEIWEFDIRGVPNTPVGATILYRNPALIFGATNGVIVFGDGAVWAISASSRIQ